MDPSAAPPAAASAPPRWLPPWLGDMWRAVLAVLPPFARRVIEAGLLRGMLLLAAVFVVLPLVLALLAAFWLVQSKKIDNEALAGLRSWYLKTIDEGFSIEEVSARSHARLDYLQLFSYELEPGRATARRELSIGLQRWQKAELDIRRVEWMPRDRDCSLSEEPLVLLNVAIGGRPLGTLRKDDANRVLVLDAAWWKRESPNMDDAGSGVLSVELADAARAVTCARVHVEGGLKVFKNLFPEARP